MGVLRRHALGLFLALLVTTGEIEAVSKATNTSTDEPVSGYDLSPNNETIEKAVFADSQFEGHGEYNAIGMALAIGSSLIMVSAYAVQFHQMLKTKECTCDQTDTFWQCNGKVIGKDANELRPFTISDKYYLMVVEGSAGSMKAGDFGNTTIVPYNGGGRSKDGFLAIMTLDVQNVPLQQQIGFHDNSLLVAIDCEQFDEHQAKTMMFRNTSLMEVIEDKLLWNSVVNLAFLNPNSRTTYCPNYDSNGVPSYISVVEAGTCKNHYPVFATEKRGMERWIEKYIDANQETKADRSWNLHDPKSPVGKRPKHFIALQTMAMQYLLILAVCAVMVCSSYFFTYYSLKRDEDGSNAFEGTHDWSNLYWMPGRTGEATNVKLILKILIGPAVFAGFIVIMAVYDYLWMVETKKWARANTSLKFESGKLMSGWIIKAVFLCSSIYFPTMLFFNAKNTTAKQGKTVKNFVVVIHMLNYLLALVFFANAAVGIANKTLGMEMPIVVDHQVSEMILGIAVLLAAIAEVVEKAREGHGTNDGCELEELGFTFREIARDYPGAFPVAAEMQLDCADTDITFFDVFNSTHGSLGDDGLLDDGSICNFICTLPATGTPKRTPTSSYPIYCIDNGISGSRWSLSDARGDLWHRLCPRPGRSMTFEQLENWRRIDNRTDAPDTPSTASIGLASDGTPPSTSVPPPALSAGRGNPTAKVLTSRVN